MLKDARILSGVLLFGLTKRFWKGEQRSEVRMPVVTQLLFPTAPRALSTPGQGWSGRRLTRTLPPRHQERSSRAAAGTQTGTSVHPAPWPPPCADVAHALPVTSCKGANQATGVPSDPGLPPPERPPGRSAGREAGSTERRLSRVRTGHFARAGAHTHT